MTSIGAPLRILVVSELWQGANSYAFARAFRRRGHSVSIVSESAYNGFGWTNKALKAARQVLMPLIQTDFSTELLAHARDLRPHLFFVCKGNMVTRETLLAIKGAGAAAILWWPDVSFLGHDPNIARAAPHYDWIFTTKTFGVRDLGERMGMSRASFMPHGFDPETHMKFAVDESDRTQYQCDVSFIGTWSPKKQSLLEALTTKIPGISLKVWGNQWEKAGKALKGYLRFRPVIGVEYAKAIVLSRVNLGILSEIRKGASSGDRITSRTFHIPACGGFMLHERTAEIRDYFVEGEECALFDSAEEMVAKVRHFLANPNERDAIAEAGRARCHASSYSIDDRAETVLAKFEELAAR